MKTVPKISCCMMVKDEEGNPVEICICYCPGCDLVPEDETWIKGYYSEQDLLNKGWYKG